MNAQDFLLNDARRDFWHENKDIIFSGLVTGKTVLDIGCGDGELLLRLYNKGKKITGVEFYDTYFKSAKQKLKDKGNLLRLDAVNQDIPGEYDTVILSGVIEHIKDDLKFAKKISKNVKKGGELLLLTSAYPWLYSVYDKNIDHYRRYSKKELVSVLKKAGFKIEAVKYWDALGIPFMIFCRLFNKIPISSEKMSNSLLTRILNMWFGIIENKMFLPFGLNLIVVARK